jgi:hypothetical protein
LDAELGRRLSLSGSILLLICFVFVTPESWARFGAFFFEDFVANAETGKPRLYGLGFTAASTF